MVESEAVHRTVLDNGLTLVTERIPTVRSASVGIWLKLGSRFEKPQHSGIAHFIEHMLFKGTTSRSARDIAIAIDAMGGQLDAFTAKESACYYAKVLDKHLTDTLELLADLILNPLFEEPEMERERGVILEEIASVDDDPEEFLFEHFFAQFWRGHPLGRPIQGTRETVGGLQCDDLRSYFRRIYDPANVVVAAAGNLSHEELVVEVTRLFGHLQRNGQPLVAKAPLPTQHFHILERQELEQVHVSVGTVAPTVTDRDRYTAYLLCTLLGGCVSSRLFHIIREENGLAYSVYSTMGSYSDAGYLWIYAATKAEAPPLVLDLIMRQLADLRANKVLEPELMRMKDQLKGSLMLSLENTAGRMSNLARQEIHFGRSFELDEILAGIDAVSVEGIQRMAVLLFDDAAVSLGLLASRATAARLRHELVGGVSLPGTGVLCPGAVPSSLTQ